MENRNMARLFAPRHLALGAAVLAGTLLSTAAPADAQQGRMRVLVPSFVNEQGQTTRAGQRMADQVRRQINQLPTHAPLEDKAWKDALKKHGLKEQDMDCIKWKQLAAVEAAMGAGLVLCGTYNEAAGTLEASFNPAGGADPFEMPAFAVQSPEQAAQELIAGFQTYTRQLSLLQYCDEHIRSQNWEQALDNCNQAVELNPRSTTAHYNRGSALLNMDRQEEALVAYQAVLEVDPIHTDALLAAGYTAAQLKQQEVSQRYLREYLSMNPGDVQVRLTIATRLANEGDPSGALRLVEEAATADAGAQVLMYAGHFAVNTGLSMMAAAGPATESNEAVQYFRKAVGHYERAMSIAPDSLDDTVLRNLMLAYSRVGNTEKALEIGRRATAAADNAQTMSIYAEVLKDAGRVDEAIAALDRAAQIDPQMGNLNARKGTLLLEAGRMQQAVAAFKEALARNEMQPAQAENVSQQLSVKGFNETQARRFDAAIPYFNAAREIGKSDRSIGMANFFHGFTLLQQADGLLRNATTAAPARQAKPLLERAKVLLEGASGYTDQAARRAEALQNVATYLEIADALIRAGR
jgi:tetratricopeptide (TPR) repeat protein